MLYIFHVDMGRMMTFEMNLALESVQYLKETIERYHGIPSNSQVLLVSGGETLQVNSRVCSYSAGTDTNPIYMFSTIIDTKNPPPPWPSIEPDSDLEEQVERCLSLPATYNTVVTRTQLAQQIYEMAKDEHKICEKLVHDQHLQQQGWAAVVANMEDITEEFKERCEDFYRGFKEHLEQRQKYVEFLQFFNSDLDKLSNIPILPGLVQNAEEKPFHAFDEIYADTESFSRANSVISTTGAPSAAATVAAMGTESSTVPNNELTAQIQNLETSNEKEIAMTLLHWISASENQKSLRSMAENCLRELNKIDEKVMSSLQIDIQKAIDAAQQENMKEIKGLEDRLCGLDKLIYDAKKVVQEQSELAQGFQQNQTRANNLRDPSILPDLCASHCSQIKVMLKKHKHLRDIRRRISKAKEELGTNLYQRLKFVIYIENRMCETDSKLLFYHRCLRRLQKHLSIVEQIHQAPFMYVTAVTEVVRRRVFSSAFFKWASDLACQLLKIYNDEVMRREDFSARFEGHFLSTLFPGMDDMPPPFATEAPSIFDSSLPHLTKTDIQVLSNHLPEITSKIQLPDLGAVIEFFASRSGSSTKSQDKSGLSDNQGVNMDQLIEKPLDIHVHLKDYERGFESETDTEEFEKVGQSPIERRHNSNNNSQIPSQTSINNNNNNDNDNLLQQIVPEIIKPEMSSISTSTIAVTTQNTETLTEENLGTTRIEVERLRDLLKKMYQLSHDSLSLVKHQLKNVKTQSLCDKKTIDMEFGKLNEMWERIQSETEQRERIMIQKLTVDHELELSDVKKSLLLKDEEIEALSNDKKELKGFHVCELVQRDKDKELLMKNMDELKSTITGLETRLLCAANEQEKAVQEMKEKLIQEHKTEIESLRCRFKLMTISMERSPSDTSLEKIERPDMIDLTNHESILLQTRENLEREHELALKTAVDRERARWETRTEKLRGQAIVSSSPKSPTTSQDLFKRILDEKERQMDVLRDRETVLLRENQKYRETIQQLAESDDKHDSNWKDKYDAILNENKILIKELNAEKQRQSENTNIMPQKDIGTITDKSKCSTCSTCTSSSASSQKSQISVYVNSCSADDTVLVVWNSFHSRYMILQENPLLYFLHADSYPLLNIETPSADGTPPKVNYFLGKVVKKEYCHAKKGNNRYKVPKGTKFYQVVVRSKSNKSLSDLRIGHAHIKDKEGSSQTNLEATSPTTKVITNEKIQQQQIQLIDSFAQTEFTKLIMDSSVGVGGNVPDGTSYDMVDSGVDEAHSKNELKPRNASLSEEDDLGDHISYTDDDDLIATKATETSAPVSIGQLKLEESSVTAATAPTEDVDDASTTTLLTNQINLPTIMTTTAEVAADITTASTETPEVIVSTTIVEKINDDDSDEYRSLEAKDDDEHFSMIN